MRLIFHDHTALALLLSTDHPAHSFAKSDEIFRNCLPTAASLSYAQRCLPQLRAPFHVLVPRWDAAGSQPLFVAHRMYRKPPVNVFLPVGRGLYTVSPELCLAQIALRARAIEVIFLGSALCGSFKIDPTAPSGLSARRPIASRASIRHFIEKNPGLNGVKPLRKCLDHITENAASPPEIFLRMAMTLPTRLGGFGLPNAHVNQRITPTQRAQRIAGRKTLVPDLLWPELKLDVEYDSDAQHLTGRQAMLDATKRLALESDGYKIITVTPLQLGSPTRLEDIAREINRCARRRMRIRSTNFPARQRELFQLDWSLSSLFSPAWMDAQRQCAIQPVQDMRPVDSPEATASRPPSSL